MTNQEFFDRTQIKVSESEFSQIHEMYMEAGDMDKDVFCREYKAHSESILLQTYFRQSNRLKDKMDRARGYIYQMADFLVDQANACSSMELRKKAIEILGIQEYLNRKIQKGYGLWDVDKTDLQEILGGHLKTQKDLY